MKTELLLKVDDSQASANITGKITSYAVGIPVRVDVSGERWEGIAPKMVVLCDKVAKEMAIVEGCSTLPFECLLPGKKLYVGVDGIDDDGTIRIPTMWAYCGVVTPSVADVVPDNVTEPTPDIVSQIANVATNAERIASDAEQTAASLVERADNHEFDGVSPTVEVEQIEDGYKVIITDKDGPHEFDLFNGLYEKAVVTSVNGMTGDVTVHYENISGLPDIPSKVSQLENDKEYVTEEEADNKYATPSDIPIVHDWALQEQRPVYTANDVGTLPITVMTMAEYDSIAIKRDDMVYLIVEA